LDYLCTLVPLSHEYFEREKHITALLQRISPLLLSPSPPCHSSCLNLLLAIHHRSREVLYGSMVKLHLHVHAGFIEHLSSKMPTIKTLISTYLQRQLKGESLLSIPTASSLNIHEILHVLSPDETGLSRIQRIEFLNLLSTLFNEHKLRDLSSSSYQQIFVSLLELTRPAHPDDIRQCSLITIAAMLDHEPDAASLFLELTGRRLLECHRHGTHAQVTDACDRCLSSWISSQDATRLLHILTDLMEEASFVSSPSIQQCALGTLMQLLEYISSSHLLKSLSSVVPILEVRITSPVDTIRKGAVDVYVKLYSILNDHMIPWMKRLEVDKAKLVTLYIHKERKKR
jgi:hypothetical protein